LPDRLKFAYQDQHVEVVAPDADRSERLVEVDRSCLGEHGEDEAGPTHQRLG
jgi:hypothetical protein